jgi:hypothetical protein
LEAQVCHFESIARKPGYRIDPNFLTAGLKVLVEDLEDADRR